MRLARDARLVEQVRRGNDAAFEVAFERHGPALLAFCRHMLGSPEEAEDALQHTFASAYRGLRSGDRRQIALKPWLFTIARNRCVSMLRARRELPVEEAEHVSTEGLAEQVERRAELRRVVADVGELPDDQRAALLLTELGDLSHAEVAGVLRCGVPRVKALVYRARSQLIARRNARETACEEIREQLATLRGGALRRTELRLHLRDCASCRAYREDVRRQREMLAAALPVAPALGLKSSVLAALGMGGSAGGATGLAGSASGLAGGATGLAGGATGLAGGATGLAGGATGLAGGATGLAGGAGATGLAGALGGATVAKVAVVGLLAGGGLVAGDSALRTDQPTPAHPAEAAPAAPAGDAAGGGPARSGRQLNTWVRHRVPKRSIGGRSVWGHGRGASRDSAARGRARAIRGGDRAARARGRGPIAAPPGTTPVRRGPKDEAGKAKSSPGPESAGKPQGPADPTKAKPQRAARPVERDKPQHGARPLERDKPQHGARPVERDKPGKLETSGPARGVSGSGRSYGRPPAPAGTPEADGRLPSGRARGPRPPAGGKPTAPEAKAKAPPELD